MMRSLTYPALEDEQMDDADLDPAIYAQVLADLASVNRWTLATRPTIDFIARAVAKRKRFSLLDVGFGDGDMLRAIARWAERHGVQAVLTGVDLNPKSAAIATARTPERFGIRYLTGDYRPLAEDRPDIIVSSLVTHHMAPNERIAFLRVMQDRAQVGWFINDLHRHVFSYLGYPLLARLMGWHRVVREDGQLSIARSFRPSEWATDVAAAGIDSVDVRITRYFPFRLCVEHIR